MNVGQLLDVLIDVPKFIIASDNSEYGLEVLYDDYTDKSKIEFQAILNIQVNYFGIYDEETIIFYVNPDDITEEMFDVY